MRLLPCLLLLLLLPVVSGAQILTQTIRGTVVDADAKFGLPGATVAVVQDSILLFGTSTDSKGSFRLEKIPVGKYTIEFSFIGYKNVRLTNILVTSAKEVILPIELEESAVALQELVVKASRDGEPQNEMALISARSFTVEETDRYAGSRGDPARMVSNYAGVQGADDSRNDIVIRGNSPQSVLWRLEGINIPNPNHFAIPGTGGGPVSIINNKILANSDFYTGAFPAEFGNTVAGVFDLRLRNGNNEKHEISGQLGFLGTEFFAEGPLSRKQGSSYLFNYRYSTLSLFKSFGINIGTSAIPRYQDLSFRFNQPFTGGGSIAFFGIGGNSDVDIMISDQQEPEENIYGENDRDQYFSSATGLVGLSYVQPLSKTTVIKLVAAASHEGQEAHHDFVYRKLISGRFVVDSLRRMLDYEFKQNKYSAIITLNHKFSSRSSIVAGVNSDLYHFNFADSILNLNEESSDYYETRTRWKSNDKSVLVQPHLQWKYKFSDQLIFTGGLHGQYFSMTKSFVVPEPRVGLNAFLKNDQTIRLGAGLHSQIQPTYVYFYSQDKNDPANLHNKKMDFTRSFHAVGGYQKILAAGLRISSEVYYQYLFDIPVEKRPSSFSLINTGAGFSRFFPDTLVNSGTGKNYGIELTIERFFSSNFFMLFTGSLFESKYKGSDGIRRDTDFNGNYAFNALFTREFQFKNKNNALALGSKVTYLGGRRYGPVDAEASIRERDVVFMDAARNSLQFDPYFRFDLRISYKVNRPRFTHEVALDLVNLFNTRNILKLTYAPIPGSTADPIRREYQLGFLPLFYYKLDFRTTR